MTVFVKYKTDNTAHPSMSGLLPDFRSWFVQRYKGFQDMLHDDDGVDFGTTPRGPYISKPKPSPILSTKQAKTINRHRRPSHRKQAAQRKRERQFIEAAEASAAAGHPITFKVCLTWHALTSAGERREGNALHLPERERVSRLWRNLRGLYRRHGLPFYIMRAPESAGDKGSHLHLALCLPPHLLSDLVAMISQHTGAAQDIEATFTASERKGGYVARSACRGWLVQRNMRIGNGGERGAAEYISKSVKHDDVQVQYRLSGELSALVKQHRAAQGGDTGAPDGR